MFRALTISAVSAAALLVSAPAFAQVQVGVLQCAGSPSVGYLIGSWTNLNCVFTPSNGRGGEAYVGGMSRLGVDVGVTSGSGITWLVFAPSATVGRGALAGEYGGVSANVSVVIGGGANVLAGGSNNSITLQPVSLQGQTGVNVAATVTGVQLQYVAPPARKRYKKKKRG